MKEVIYLCYVFKMFKLEQTHSSTAEIATALANSVSSMLGSPFHNKWIISEDEPILSHDILLFLQNVDIEHPIGQLIRTCCEEYHSSFGCGTKTVLYLIGQWTNLCCNLKFQGIPISILLFLLKESVRDCITFLDHLAIPTENFLDHSEGTHNKKNKKLDPGYSMFTVEDPGKDDILTKKKSPKKVDLDLADEDVSWFLNEANQETLPMTTLDHRISDTDFYDRKNGSCESSAYLKNNALNKPTDSTKSNSSFYEDEDFASCFDYLDVNDTNICEKNIHTSNEAKLEISASNSSFLSSTPSTGKTYRADHFFEYLNSKYQQFQNQALSSTIWSSRHLSSSASEHKFLNFTEHEDRDILKTYITISGTKTERKDIPTMQHKTLKKCQVIDSSVDHSKNLNSNTGIKDSWTQDKYKYLSDLQTKNSCIMLQISKKKNDRDHFSGLESNTNKFHNIEFPESLIRPADFKTKDSSYSQDVSGEISLQCLESLVYGLCHGSNEYIKDLLIKVLKHQNRSTTQKNKPLRLHLNMLHLCCLQGPCIDNSCFLPGVVLSAKEKRLHFWDLTKMQNLSHNVLLVKTSVMNNIHHVGYQKLAKVENTCTREEYILSRKMSARDKWINHVQWILKQLKVTILVATGKVDKNLVEILSCSGILVFENTEQTAVEALASLNENTRIEPVVYITDATQKNVLPGILMEPLNADTILSSNQHSQELYIVLSTPQCQVQTLVLHHPAQAGLDLLAQEFQLSSHRVSSALNHGKVLPGGGTTEQKCADYLLNKAELLRKQTDPNSNGHELYMAEILLKLAESFQSFAKCVALNSGRMNLDTSYNLILDDHFTKIQSWKTALQLVSILTRIDAQVVLGIPQ